MESFDPLSAPEFPKDSVWLNSKETLSLEKLKGHIVVLDFWTYCCINCMHILPDLEFLEKKYCDKPVIVIGIHSAKFDEEADEKNIQEAVNRYEIKHPVVVDKNMQIWNSYGANGWPTIVVIDPDGKMVYKKSGEGQREALVEVIDTMLEYYGEKNKLAKKKIHISIEKNTHKFVLKYPGKISFSPDKKYFALSDSNNHRILVLDLSGKIKEIIGSGEKGQTDSDFKSSSFNRPQGVCWIKRSTKTKSASSLEGIYVADTENHKIRFVNLKEKSVLTIAGTGRQSVWPSYGGSGTEVELSSPWDIVERDGLLYIAMAGLHQIWVYDPISHHIRPFAGNSRENIKDGQLLNSEFAQPSGITLLNSNIYVADSEVSGIRKIDVSGNLVSTVCGKGLFSFGMKDGDVKEALFQHPLGITCYGNTLYIADTYNNAIRQIDLKSRKVSTLVHKKEGVCMIGDETCDILGLWEPSDVKYFEGILYIVDTNNHLIRKFNLKTNKLETLEIK